MQHLTEVQQLASAMRDCVSAMYADGKTDGKWKATTGSQNLFDPVKGSAHTLWVGYDLENKVQNKTDDGQIYCSGDSGNQSDVVDLFAQAIGVELGDLWCNGSEAGIFQAYYYDGSSEQKYTDGGGCKDHFNESTTDSYYYKWADQAQVDTYLASLYNNYVNNFAQQYGIPANLYSEWADAGRKSDVQQYYSQLNDFMALCTTGNSVAEGSQVNANNYYSPVYYNIGGTGGQDVLFERKSGLSASNKTRCDNMVASLNGYHEVVDTTFSELNKDILKQDCIDDK